MKKVFLYGLLIASILFSACGLPEETGRDEPLPPGDPVVSEWKELLLPLFPGESLDPVVFSDYASSQERIRNSVLGYMLYVDYPLFTSAGEAYREAVARRPESIFFNLIPQDALEDRLYRLFGVTSFRHSDTDDFEYYPDLCAYSAPCQPPVGKRVGRDDITVYSCEENEVGSTLLFRVYEDGGEVCGKKYTAVFARSDSGYRLRAILPAD